MWQYAIAYGLIASSLLLGACGGLKKTLEDTLPDREAEYKSSRSLPPLEVPPDLSLPAGTGTMEIPGSGSTTYSDYVEGGSNPSRREGGVLPEFTDIRVDRSGDKRWLVIKAAPDQVWPKAREFWLQNGFLIKMEDPTIGIMETDWADNRAEIPQGFIRGLLEKVTTAL